MESRRRQNNHYSIRRSIPEVRSLGSNQLSLSLFWASGTAVNSGGQKLRSNPPLSYLFFPTLKAQGRRSSPACRYFSISSFELYLPPARELYFVPPFFFSFFTQRMGLSPVFLFVRFRRYRPAVPSTWYVLYQGCVLYGTYRGTWYALYQECVRYGTY